MTAICPVVKRLDARLWPLWVEYEKEKSDWLTQHPNATADELAKVCREIADGLGI